MRKPIEHVVVVGSGVMGAAIAAHFANARYAVSLLDIVPSEVSVDEARQGLDSCSPAVRNRLVRTGLERARKSKPPAFFLPEYAQDVRIGNLEDNAGWLSEADWIIEAVTEDYEIKRTLLKRIDSLRKPGTIISSNTSGISIQRLASGLSEDFRLHWLGTHFFNPPRYMKLVEIVPSDEVLPAVLDSIIDLCGWHLGKSIVSVKDTPNFIANRVGTFAIQTVFHLMQESGLGIEEIDLLTGPILGRPKSATFRTLDIIGLDTYAHVILNIYENAKDDEHREIFKIPSLLESLIRKNWLGDKTRQGFYKRLKTQEILTLDPQTLEYLPRQEVELPSLATAQAIPTIEERLSFLVNCPDQVGKFVWRFLSQILVYAANRIPEISDSIVDIDNALKWGFNWELGPFETWDALGPETVCQRIRREGSVVPLWVEQLLATPEKRFYARQDGQRFHFVPSTRSYAAAPEPHGVLFLSSLKDRGKVVRKANSGSLLDLGDGIACLEFHSKMNTIDDELLRMIEETLEMIRGSFRGLLIANQGQHFCAGANLKLILKNAQEKNWQAIDDMIRTFQRVNMKIKYSSRPVVVAPFGMTLGGGCEIALHSCSLQAAAETYMGLVELGVGLIPAAGGTKEMLLRTLEKIAGCPGGDFSAHLRQTFETIATGKVSSSASEARKLAFLRETDGVTMNRDRLLADGKHRILGLLRQGFIKPLPPKGVIAYGKRALALLKLGIHLARKAEQISDYDALLGTKLAFVLCGGDGNNLQEVSEAYILDLEREVFLSLCGQERTQARIEHMLETGKRLRN